MFLSWYPPLVFSQGCSPTRKSVFSICFVKSWLWYGKPHGASWRSITSPCGSHLGYQPPDMKVDHGGHVESCWLCASLPWRPSWLWYGQKGYWTDRCKFSEFFPGKDLWEVLFFWRVFCGGWGLGGGILRVYQWILIVWIKFAGFLCSYWCAVPLRWLMISPATCISQHGGYLVSSIFCHRSLQSMIGVIGMRDLFWKTCFSLYLLPK